MPNDRSDRLRPQVHEWQTPLDVGTCARRQQKRPYERRAPKGLTRLLLWFSRDVQQRVAEILPYGPPIHSKSFEKSRVRSSVRLRLCPFQAVIFRVAPRVAGSSRGTARGRSPLIPRLLASTLSCRRESADGNVADMIVEGLVARARNDNQRTFRIRARIPVRAIACRRRAA